MWGRDKEYIAGQQKVKALKVVNDAAERGVALIQAFNGVLTCQEEQKQFLLQVIGKYRHDFPHPNKSTLTAAAATSTTAAD